MSKLVSIVTAALFATSSFALAQTTPSVPPKTPTSPPAATQPPAAMPGNTLNLTEDQVQNWVGKPIYSSDGKNLGEVAAFVRDTTGRVTEMHADIGGFLGIGETRVRLLPTQFKLADDRIVVDMMAEQAKSLPQIKK